jgi:hypothetical protein
MYKMTSEVPAPKWIHAQRINGGEWKLRFYSFREECPDLDNSRMMDETQIGEMKQSEFAIFRYCENWQDHRPRRLLDLRDKSGAPIRGLGGLINALESDWF